MLHANMHHDAITGTAEPWTQREYRETNLAANGHNNPLYADSLGRIIENNYGLRYLEDWKKYDTLETISHNYPTEGDLYTILNDTSKIVTVALQNPSNVQQSVVKFKIDPEATQFSVQVFDRKENEFVDVQHKEIHCHFDF